MQPLQIEVQLELNAPCNPEVRAWVDLHPNANLDSERELTLRRSLNDTWIATLPATESPAESFMYRVAVAAGTGTIWSLSIRDPLGDEVLTDSDVMPLPKSWLIGTCSLTRKQRTSAEPGPVARRVPLVGIAGGRASDGARSQSRQGPQLKLIRSSTGAVAVRSNGGRG